MFAAFVASGVASMVFSRVASRVLVSLLLGVTAAAATASSPRFKAGVFEPPRQAPEFALRLVDVSELAKAEGAITCCSLILNLPD